MCVQYILHVLKKELKESRTWFEWYHSTVCCSALRFLSIIFKWKKRLVFAFDPLFCVHWEPLWYHCLSLCKDHTNSYCTHPIRTALFLIESFVPFLECASAIWGEMRAGSETEISDGLWQGSAAGPRLLMTWGHSMCLSLRRHKRAGVFGVLKMYHEMTQLGPHSFCMRRTHGGIL